MVWISRLMAISSLSARAACNDARKALSAAIAEIVNDPSTKAGGFIKKAFGGPATISGSELGGLLAKDAADAETLMKAVQ